MLTAKVGDVSSGTDYAELTYISAVRQHIEQRQMFLLVERAGNEEAGLTREKIPSPPPKAGSLAAFSLSRSNGID